MASINCSLLLVKAFWSFAALRRNCLAIILQAKEKDNRSDSRLTRKSSFVCGERICNVLVDLLYKMRIAKNSGAVIDGTSLLFLWAQIVCNTIFPFATMITCNFKPT